MAANIGKSLNPQGEIPEKTAFAASAARPLDDAARQNPGFS
jgi:hypothetical protein